MDSIIPADIEKTLKSIASNLKIGYEPFGNKGFYNFIYKDKLLVTISVIMDHRKNTANFIAKVPDNKPVSWGSFEKEKKVYDKIEKTISSKLKELLVKQ